MNKTPFRKKLFDIGEAAIYLGMSISTLRQWDESGKLKAIRLATRGKRMYNKEDLDRFAKGQK